MSAFQGNAKLADRYCVECGHSFEAHLSGRCDVEVRDYGDMDCGCRGAFRVDFAAATGTAALAGGDTDGTPPECHICHRPRSGPGEAYCSASHDRFGGSQSEPCGGETDV